MPEQWNLRRGLNRLFVVLSVCWYIGAGIYLWPRWEAVRVERSTTDWFKENAPGAKAKKYGLEVSDKPPTGTQQWEVLSVEDARPLTARYPLLLTAAILLVPPGVYGFALAGLWAFRGFRV